MMKKISLLILMAVVVFACRNEKKRSGTMATVDTLTYTYDSVKVTSKNIVKPVENQLADTANAVIKYPVFKNDTLNNYIKRQVFNFFAQEEKVTSYQDIANSFISGYEDFYRHNAETPQWWYLMIDLKVIKQTSNYIALKYIHSDYAGGAHGNTVISFINFNPKTNQPVLLDSLIQPDKKEELLRLGESIFRKNEKLSPIEPLEGKYFFDKGKFHLPASFYVGDKGLVFLYNPYEIKAYVYGTTELTIPFANLANIAKANTILTTKK
jgi:hypothetical protein